MQLHPLALIRSWSTGWAPDYGSGAKAKSRFDSCRAYLMARSQEDGHRPPEPDGRGFDSRRADDWPVAHQEARRFPKPEAASSSLARPIDGAWYNGGALVLQTRECRFDSGRPDDSGIVQLAERHPGKVEVPGSTPGLRLCAVRSSME